MPQTSHITSTYGLLITPPCLFRFQNKQNPLPFVHERRFVHIHVIWWRDSNQGDSWLSLQNWKKPNKNHKVFLISSHAKNKFSSCGSSQQWSFTVAVPSRGPGTQYVPGVTICFVKSWAWQYMMNSWFYWFPFIPCLYRPCIGSRQKHPHNMSHHPQTPKSYFHGYLVPQKSRHWRESVQLRVLFCCSMGLTWHPGLASWCFTSLKASPPQ